MKVELYGVLLLLLAASCKQQSQKAESHDNGDTVVVSSCSESDTFIVSGHMVWGHEVRSFAPEGTEDVYWLSDKTGRLEAWYLEQIGTDAEPYTAVDVTLKVRNLGQATDGFAVDYTSVYEVLDFNPDSIR